MTSYTAIEIEPVSGGGLSQTTNTTYSYGNVSVNEGKEAKTNYTNAFITTESIDGMTTGITYQDGMGRTVRQVSDSQVTEVCQSYKK